jgi:hypothetical protein
VRISEELLIDRAEQTFFEDQALDRAFGVVMALATEVYVLRDRMRAMERILDHKGLLASADLDAEPGDEERLAGKQDRDAFVEGLLINLLGQQQARGAR